MSDDSRNPELGVRVSFTIRSTDLSDKEVMSLLVEAILSGLIESTTDLIKSRTENLSVTSGFALPNENTPFDMDVRVKLHQ